MTTKTKHLTMTIRTKMSPREQIKKMESNKTETKQMMTTIRTKNMTMKA